MRFTVQAHPKVITSLITGRTASFPRRREFSERNMRPMAECKKDWIPAFAGMTKNPPAGNDKALIFLLGFEKTLALARTLWFLDRMQ